MNCAECSTSFSLYTYTYYRHAMPAEGHRWIETTKLERALSLKYEVESIKNRIIFLAHERYLEPLLQHFESSNKKTIWGAFNSKISSFKSLNSFYQSTSGWSKAEYLGTFFRDRYLDAVFSLIKVRDNEIDGLRKKAHQFAEEADELLSGRG